MFLLQDLRKRWMFLRFSQSVSRFGLLLVVRMLGMPWEDMVVVEVMEEEDAEDRIKWRSKMDSGAHDERSRKKKM